MARIQFPHVLQSSDHVQTQDIRLSLLQPGGLIPESLTDGTLPVYGVLDTQSVGHFMEHGVLEEGIEGHQSSLILRHEDIDDGSQDPFELGPHGILELEAPGAQLKLDLRVVGKVDGDGLRPGVCITPHVHHVVHVQVSVGTGSFGLVLWRNRESSLQFGEKSRIPGQPLAPFPILHKDEGLVAGFIPEELIFIRLDGPDDHIDPVVFHLHPGKVAGLVLIGQEGVRPELQVPLQPWVLRKIGGGEKKVGGPAHRLGKGLRIGNRHQFPDVIPPDHGIEASQGFAPIQGHGNRSLELLHRHVLGIEPGPGGLRSRTGDEGRVPVDTVPGPEVDHPVSRHGRVA